MVRVYAGGLEKDWVASLSEAARELRDAAKELGAVGDPSKISKTKKRALADTLEDKRDFSEHFVVEWGAKGNHDQANEG